MYFNAGLTFLHFLNKWSRGLLLPWSWVITFSVIYFPELHQWRCLMCVWAYLLIRHVFPTARSPTTMTLEILNLLRGIKEDSTKWINATKTPNPVSSGCWFLLSPHSAGALLLAGRLHFIVEILLRVKSCLFLEILQEKKGDLWGCFRLMVDN